MSRDQSTVKDRTAFLIEHRTVLIGYLYSKAKMEDWHGVSDAANDLRELEAEMKTRGMAMSGVNLPNMPIETVFEVGVARGGEFPIEVGKMRGRS